MATPVVPTSSSGGSSMNAFQTKFMQTCKVALPKSVCGGLTVSSDLGHEYLEPLYRMNRDDPNGVWKANAGTTGLDRPAKCPCGGEDPSQCTCHDNDETNVQMYKIRVGCSADKKYRHRPQHYPEVLQAWWHYFIVLLYALLLAHILVDH